MSQKDSVTIACISNYMGLEGQGAYMNRPYGSYFLKSCTKGQAYSVLVIEDATDYKRIDIDLVTPPEFIPIVIPAEAIAKDFIANCNLVNEGGFICAGKVPTEGELSDAHVKRHSWLVKSVQFGDTVFGRLGNRGIEQIPDYCKRAVAELEEIRDWVFQPMVAKTECEGCGNRVSLLKDGSKPAICGACGAPLDMEKAIRLGLFKPVAFEQQKELVEANKPSPKGNKPA